MLFVNESGLKLQKHFLRSVYRLPEKSVWLEMHEKVWMRGGLTDTEAKPRPWRLERPRPPVATYVSGGLIFDYSCFRQSLLDLIQKIYEHSVGISENLTFCFRTLHQVTYF